MRLRRQALLAERKARRAKRRAAKKAEAERKRKDAALLRSAWKSLRRYNNRTGRANE